MNGTPLIAAPSGTVVGHPQWCEIERCEVQEPEKNRIWGYHVRRLNLFRSLLNFDHTTCVLELVTDHERDADHKDRIRVSLHDDGTDDADGIVNLYLMPSELMLLADIFGDAAEAFRSWTQS